MSGETEESANADWTIASLKEHFERLIKSGKKRASSMYATAEEVGTLRAEVAVLRTMVEAMTELTEAKFVTFRVLVESQAEKVALALTASKEAIDKAEIATSKAIDKAEIANDKRFAAVNEFRDQLSDQQATYITRIEATAMADRNTERISEVAERLDRAERSG